MPTLGAGWESSLGPVFVAYETLTSATHIDCAVILVARKGEWANFTNILMPLENAPTLSPPIPSFDGRGSTQMA